MTVESIKRAITEFGLKRRLLLQAWLIEQDATRMGPAIMDADAWLFKQNRDRQGAD